MPNLVMSGRTASSKGQRVRNSSADPFRKYFSLNDHVNITFSLSNSLTLGSCIFY